MKIKMKDQFNLNTLLLLIASGLGSWVAITTQHTATDVAVLKTSFKSLTELIAEHAKRIDTMVSIRQYDSDQTRLRVEIEGIRTRQAQLETDLLKLKQGKK